MCGLAKTQKTSAVCQRHRRRCSFAHLLAKVATFSHPTDQPSSLNAPPPCHDTRSSSRSTISPPVRLARMGSIAGRPRRSTSSRRGPLCFTTVCVMRCRVRDDQSPKIGRLSRWWPTRCRQSAQRGSLSMRSHSEPTKLLAIGFMKVSRQSGRRWRVLYRVSLGSGDSGYPTRGCRTMRGGSQKRRGCSGHRGRSCWPTSQRR